MTFAFRRFAWNIHPTGLGVPGASQGQFPGFDPSKDKNQTRSGGYPPEEVGLSVPDAIVCVKRGA